MITLLHCTAGVNQTSILKRGLLASKSRGKRKAVWFVPPGEEWAALYHAMRSQGRPLRDPIVVTVKLPEEWVINHGSGLWYCCRDVPVDRISKVIGFKPERRDR